MQHDVRTYLLETPLEDLGDAFTILAKRAQEHREIHDGFIPFSIFPQALGIGGMYWCIEIAIEVYDGDTFVGYALKKRNGSDEQGWRDKFQLPGVVQRSTDRFEDNFPIDPMERIGKEVFKNPADWVKLRQATYFGFEFHRGSERYGVLCGTFEWLYRIQKTEMEQFVGIWEIFVDGHDDHIVDHQQRTIEWLKIPNASKFMDLR